MVTRLRAFSENGTSCKNTCVVALCLHVYFVTTYVSESCSYFPKRRQLSCSCKQEQIHQATLPYPPRGVAVQVHRSVFAHFRAGLLALKCSVLFFAGNWPNQSSQVRITPSSVHIKIMERNCAPHRLDGSWATTSIKTRKTNLRTRVEETNDHVNPHGKHTV